MTKQLHTRYCPECGHVGDVGPEHRDCCPDGSSALMAPTKYAQELRAGLKALLATSPAQAAQWETVRQAVRDYHYALDTRQHGGSAAWKALGTIQEALGMRWEHGAEVSRRAFDPTGTAQAAQEIAA